MRADNFGHFIEAFSREQIGSLSHLAKVDSSAVSRFQAMLRDETVKESTILCYLKHLRAALSWAHELGMLTDIPKITLPKRGRTSKKMRGRPLVGEEFDRLLAAVPLVRANDADMWCFYLRGLWLSGLRLSESLVLSWDDDTDLSIDLSGRHPRFRIFAEGQKRFQDELLPMTPDFAEWLLATPESERNGLVFNMRGRKNHLLAADTVGRIVSAIGSKAGIVVDKQEGKNATCHDLRRSFATRWSRRVKPATLQLLMRHADIKTTMTHYVDQDADEVADELWQEHQKSGQLGNTLGNTPPAHPQSKTL